MLRNSLLALLAAVPFAANAQVPIDLGTPTAFVAGLSATGTTQATATVIKTQVSIFDTVASGGAVALPSSGAAGVTVTVVNRGTNPLLIYPTKGGVIDSLAVNAPYTLAVGSHVGFQNLDTPMAPGLTWISVAAASTSGGNNASIVNGTLSGTTNINNTLIVGASSEFRGQVVVDTTTSGTGSVVIVPSTPFATNPTTHQLDSFVYNAAGTAATPAGTGATYSAVTGYSQIAGAQNNYMWGGTFVADYGGTGGTGQHVGIYGQGLRRTATAQTTTVTATLSSPGTTVAIADVQSFQTHNGLPVSSTNTIPILINGQPYFCVGVSATSGAGTITTSANVTTTDATSGNTVVGSNNPQIWAATLESTDMTGLSSKHTNAQLSTEFDLKANGADDSDPTFGSRQILSVVGDQYNPSGDAVEIGIGAGFYMGGTGHFKRIIHLGAPFTVAAIDTRYATQTSGNVLWLGDNQTVALDSAGAHTLYYDTSHSKLYYQVSGVTKFSVDDSGNVKSAGTMTASTTP